MKVLMVGALGTGGVSTHNEALIKEFKDLELDFEFYNYYHKEDWRPGQRDLLTFWDNFIKLGKMSLGFLGKLIGKRKKVDIIHVQASGPMGGFLPAIFGAFYKKFFGFKYIVTFHYSNTEAFVKGHSKIFGYVLKRCDAFITVSHRQKNCIIETFGEELSKKVHPIPNGFHPNLKEFGTKKEIRKELGFKDDEKVFLNVGWVVEKKGHIYLVEAMKLLTKDVKKVKCFVVGKGPLVDEMNEKVKENGIEDNLQFLGYLPQDDLLKRFIASDLFVLPSLEEGNPIVMFEALGFGLPFIGTDVGGIPEIINDEKYGILVKKGDPEAFAGAISKALKKKWNRDELIEYSKRFTWENIAKRTISLYEKVL